MSLLRPVSRRRFLAAGVGAASNFVLTGCRHGMQIFKTGALVTPPTVPLGPALTIDVHCHIFNGTDLQIEKFVGDIVFPSWWGKAAGEILELVNWNLAPSGDEEKTKLERLVATCKSAGHVTKISSSVQSVVSDLRNECYQRARRAVLDVQQKEAEAKALVAPPPTLSSLNTQEAKRQLFESFAAPDYATFERRLLVPASLTDNMRLELSSARAPEAAMAPCATTESNTNSEPFSFKAAAEFILQYFQYRYVSAQDYLNTFTPLAQRDVDLLLAAMVDYDWWLAGGNPSPTSLDTQLDVMMLISILSDGRVHGYAPYCPLREVAARAGFKNKKGVNASSSLAFVQDAVRNKGCIGVKLYPPMGFAAYGNSTLDDPSQGGRQDFWKGGLLPEWTSGKIPYKDGTVELLGQRLDGALDELYKWCVDEQVPILAHTSESNGPSCAYEKLAKAQYWNLALARHPDLRVSFGHLGGLDNSIASTALPSASRDFVALLGATSSPRTYGDVAYSSSILLNESEFDERVQLAYQQAAAGKSQLPTHLMYGTDWSLLEMVGNNEVYMQRFEQLFSRMSGVAPPAHSFEDSFFAWNAVEYLGLRTDPTRKNARSRLEAFYAQHCMPEPVWLQKLSNS